ncbi:membrane frizzled-related protein-like [Montipora foliosa]|uniref:membrane frizzled-related protein-like n=1 Tax=Montipora foliosa TaxID=591990 RepID=UPI0035F1F6FB
MKCSTYNFSSITSSARHLVVQFRSESTCNYTGFEARYTVLSPGSADSSELCLPGNPNNNNLKIAGEKGNLKSPLEYYPPDLDCNWLITAPVGNTVKLTFNRFRLDPISTCGDYVQIIDGESGVILEQYCPSRSPYPIESTSRYLRVRFVSDSYGIPDQYEGFYATFEAIESSSSSAITIAVTVSVAVFIIVVTVAVVVVKRKRALNRESVDTRLSPVATATLANAGHSAHVDEEANRQTPQTLHEPADDSHPIPTVDPIRPPATNPQYEIPPPEYPYPQTPPPPYPGQGEVLQYPPTGESYPWLMSQ